MCMAYRPSDAEPAVIRKLLLGALRYGKPFVIDMLSMPLEEAAHGYHIFDGRLDGATKVLLEP